MNGTGSLTLAGANTYPTPTVVNSGVLDITGSVAGPVVINGGTLKVEGSIGGSLTATGGVIQGVPVLTVGDSLGVADAPLTAGVNTVGSITTAGALSLLSDSVFKFEFDSSTGLADQVAAKGISLAAGATFSGLDLAVASSLLPPNTTFVVLNNTSGNPINGAFANVLQGDPIMIGQNLFVASYTGGDGNDFTLTTIPEPTSASLLSGVVGVLGLRRIRRRERV